MPPPDYTCDTCGAVVPESWVRQEFVQNYDYGKLEPGTDEFRQRVYRHSLYEAGNCPGQLVVRP